MLSVAQAVEELRSGNMLIVVDDKDRENEGDLICPAENVTAERINFIVSQARGLLCAAITGERARELKLPYMTQENTSLHNTNFTVSVDAVHNTTTGISTHDRAVTLRTLADPNAKPTDLARPGHIFPIMAQEGGVLNRNGHTEATVDLMNLAGFQPVGVLCEILNEDGSMARLDSLKKFSELHSIGILTIEELVRYRQGNLQMSS